MMYLIISILTVVLAIYFVYKRFKKYSSMSICIKPTGTVSMQSQNQSCGFEPTYSDHYKRSVHIVEPTFDEIYKRRIL